MSVTVWEAFFYVTSFSIPIYYIGAIACLWQDWVLPKKISHGVQTFYGLVYLGVFLYMAITQPGILFNFTYDGVQQMMGYPEIVVTSVNHYYCMDIFLAIAVLESRGDLVGQQFPKTLKLLGSLILALAFLFGPIGFLIYLPYLWLANRHQRQRFDEMYGEAENFF